MNRKQGFKQVDVTRALKGAVSAGMNVGRVEIQEGKIVLIAETSGPDAQAPFDSWKAKRNAGKA